MLKDEIARYVEWHRSAGFKYRTQSILLLSFAAFAERRGDNVVRMACAVEWAGQAPSPAQRRNRLLTVRRFALAMQLEDDRHEIPPADALGRHSFRRRTPYVFSAEDIGLLLASASELEPKNSIRPATYVTLFALVAVTGMRISEALNIDVRDLTADGLLIRGTKFHKSRLLPLHETTQRALERYLKQRAGAGPIDSTLFISQRGTALPYSTVIQTFLALSRKTGLCKGPGHRGPRIHDLRHYADSRIMPTLHASPCRWHASRV